MKSIITLAAIGILALTGCATSTPTACCNGKCKCASGCCKNAVPGKCCEDNCKCGCCAKPAK